MKKKLEIKTGQAGGLACKKRYGQKYYSDMAKKAHARRRALIEKALR